ncbi:MAG: sulfur carrier protein ThiS [Chloroflexota bacterium]|nr:sulfur carrier protein ThiS [Chloroflexota bacterium]
MKITVNGKPREIAVTALTGGAVPLPEFLRSHDINPRLVAVAINGDVIPKDQYEAAEIREGDAIEVVRMVGGGA